MFESSEEVAAFRVRSAGDLVLSWWRRPSGDCTFQLLKVQSRAARSRKGSKETGVISITLRRQLMVMPFVIAPYVLLRFPWEDRSR